MCNRPTSAIIRSIQNIYALLVLLIVHFELLSVESLRGLLTDVTPLFPHN